MMCRRRSQTVSLLSYLAITSTSLVIYFPVSLSLLFSSSDLLIIPVAFIDGLLPDPSSNLVMKALKENMEDSNPKVFGEKLMLLVNRGGEC